MAYSYTLRSVNDVTEDSTQEAHMCVSWVLPRKVGKMVWIFDDISFEENDVCFLCASYYVPLILTYGYMKKIMCASCVLPTMYVPLILSYGYNLYKENDVCFLLCSTS